MLTTLNQILPLVSDFIRTDPPGPEPEHPAAQVALGLGFAGAWLFGLVLLLIGLVLVLPMLFRSPRPRTGTPAS